MAEPKPTSENDDTGPRSGQAGSVPFIPLPRDNSAQERGPDPDRSSPAPSRASVPEVPGRPATPSLGFTLSEIFDQPSAEPKVPSGAAVASTAPRGAEDPGIAQALARGEKLYPDIMRASGHAVRNALLSVMPVTFGTSSNFGADDLAQAARLVGQVSKMTDDLHKIDAAGQIRAIVARADQAKAKTSWLSRLGIHEHFDLPAACAQIDTIRNALTSELYGIRKAAIDFERVMIPLNVAIAVAGILADMTSEADMGALVARRADLFTASVTEVEVAKKQVENLRKLAQEGIVECDELKTVTLPAMGLRQSLS